MVFGIVMNSKTVLQKRVPTIIGRSTVFWENNSAIGRLSERENTRNAFMRRRSIVRIMVDHHMDAWLHRGTVICMCAQLMSGPGLSSLVRFDFEEETIARPHLPDEKEGRWAETKEPQSANERDGYEEWPAGSPESAARCTHVQHERTREPRFSNYWH